MNIRLLGEFCYFSVNPRWRPVVKYRQNVGKPSFCKLTMVIPVEVTPQTSLSNFVRVRCEFLGQFRRLVQAKIRPSSHYNKIITMTFIIMELNSTKNVIRNDICYCKIVTIASILNILALTVLAHYPLWKPGECLLVQHCDSNSWIHRLP